VKKPVKVLIVEDSEDDAKLALRILRSGGFDPTYRRVQTAAELETALAHERWDAVISDFMMPGFTGLDALRMFRCSGLDIPFILVSGTIGEETAANAMKAGASDYVMKKNLARLAPALQRELKETQIRAAHRRAEEELLRFAAGMDAISDAIVLIDRASMRLVHVNDAACRYMNKTREELLKLEPWVLSSNLANSRRSLSASLIRSSPAASPPNRRKCRGPSRTVHKHGPKFGGTHFFSGDRWMIVTLVRDITERKKADQKFKDLLESAPDAMVIVTTTPKWCWSTPRRSSCSAGAARNCWGSRSKCSCPNASAASINETGAIFRTTASTVDGRGTGTVRAAQEWHRIPGRSQAEPTGDNEGTVVISAIRDITERKEAENRIRRLNRVYAVLTGINTLIVRTRDRQDLFDEACRIAVEQGKFRLAWIGLLDANGVDITPWPGRHRPGLPRQHRADRPKYA